jgi:hypothetical protein
LFLLTKHLLFRIKALIFAEETRFAKKTRACYLEGI